LDAYTLASREPVVWVGSPWPDEEGLLVTDELVEFEKITNWSSKTAGKLSIILGESRGIYSTTCKWLDLEKQGS
jgi:hypothetical protein